MNKTYPNTTEYAKVHTGGNSARKRPIGEPSSVPLERLKNIALLSETILGDYENRESLVETGLIGVFGVLSRIKMSKSTVEKSP